MPGAHLRRPPRCSRTPCHTSQPTDLGSAASTNSSIGRATDTRTKMYGGARHHHWPVHPRLRRRRPVTVRRADPEGRRVCASRASPDHLGGEERQFLLEAKSARYRGVPLGPREHDDADVTVHRPRADTERVGEGLNDRAVPFGLCARQAQRASA